MEERLNVVMAGWTDRELAGWKFCGRKNGWNIA
jgi:hypothetical protein